MIPDRVLTRAPSAELRPNQTDQDSLPDYFLLDKILQLYIEQNLDVSEIIDKGHDSGLVKSIICLVKGCEYKRSQSAIGPKVTGRAFGKDWRVPIANGF